MLRLTIWQNCTLMMIWLNRELEYVMVTWTGSLLEFTSYFLLPSINI